MLPLLQSKKNEMNGACNTYLGEVITGFWWGNLRKLTTWKTWA